MKIAYFVVNKYGIGLRNTNILSLRKKYIIFVFPFFSYLIFLHSDRCSSTLSALKVSYHQLCIYQQKKLQGSSQIQGWCFKDFFAEVLKGLN